MSWERTEPRGGKPGVPSCWTLFGSAGPAEKALEQLTGRADRHVPGGLLQVVPHRHGELYLVHLGGQVLARRVARPGLLAHEAIPARPPRDVVHVSPSWEGAR